VSRALPELLGRGPQALLMVVLLSVLWTSPGHAHSAHKHDAIPQPAVGAATLLEAVASTEKAPVAASATSVKTWLRSQAQRWSPDSSRDLVWVEERDSQNCGANCASDCIGCDCGACQGGCLAGDECFTSCASAQGALISQDTNLPCISQAAQYLFPMTGRADGRTLSPEPPPPKL